MRDIFIVEFDGGKNKTLGGYGSYRVMIGDQIIACESKEPYDAATNNEAEYQSLRRGMEALLNYLQSQNRSPKEVRVLVRGDSELVINQLTGEYALRAVNLFPHYSAIINMARKFRYVEYTWHSRTNSVKAFGH